MIICDKVETTLTLELRPDSISMSTAFSPDANLDDIPPDIILLSSDNVLFLVHSHVLRNASTNHFNSTLLSPPQMRMDLGASYRLNICADVLNIVLLTAYKLSVAEYAPTVATLISSIDALHKCGMPFDRFLAPSTPLFTHILSQAPLSPIDFYAAAANHCVEDLAIPVSSYLLSFPPSEITDEMSQQMGALYLKRLMLLQINRNQELRNLLHTPPSGHPSTLHCGFVERRGLTKEWTLVTAELSSQVRPDFPARLLQATLDPLHTMLTCRQCKDSVNSRIRQMVCQWSLSKRTV